MQWQLNYFAISMINIKTKYQINYDGLTAKQGCKIATTSKTFMVQYKSKIHLTDEPYTYIMTRMPNVLASEIDIYQLK